MSCIINLTEPNRPIRVSAIKIFPGGVHYGFKVYQKELELQSRGWIPTFHDVSKEVLEIVKASGVKNGTCTIASHHTTCSVMIQECSHDIDSFDLEYLQHDLLDIMRKMIPDFAEEHQYRHPGPITRSLPLCERAGRSIPA